MSAVWAAVAVAAVLLAAVAVTTAVWSAGRLLVLRLRQPAGQHRLRGVGWPGRRWPS